jgi:hypothetical protein
VSGVQGHCPAKASFSWDGRPVGAAAFAGAQVCVATLRFAPPADDRAAGKHTVSAIASGTGSSGSGPYVVDPAATPSASPSPSKPSAPTASPTPARTSARPTATASADDPFAVPPAASDPAAGDPSPSTNAVHPVGSSGPLVPWMMAGGGLLVLGGVLIIGILLYYGRRPADGDDPGDDAPTMEHPRQPMPEV